MMMMMMMRRIMEVSRLVALRSVDYLYSNIDSEVVLDYKNRERERAHKDCKKDKQVYCCF